MSHGKFVAAKTMTTFCVSSSVELPETPEGRNYVVKQSDIE